MQKNIISLETSSPDELKKQLGEFSKNKKKAIYFAELKIFGPGVLVRQFDLPPLGGRDLVNALRLEAVEIFSLPAETIELDYKVIDTSAGRTKGIYIAVPTERLDAYMSCFDKTDVIPVKMTAGSISLLGKFLKAHQEAMKNNFCLLDFTRANTINLAVFINGVWELIREINFENDDDAEQGVLNSLKYSYGRSVAKQLNKLYFSGNVAGKEDLIQRLKSKIEIEPKAVFAGETSKGSRAFHHGLFSQLNLIKHCSLIAPVRNGLVLAGTILLVLGLVICLPLTSKVMDEAKKIKKLRAYFTPAEYAYAQQLREKVKVHQHGQ